MATSPETAEVASVSNENGKEQLKEDAVDVTEENENENDKASNGSVSDSDTSNDTKNGGELENPADDDSKVEVTDDRAELVNATIDAETDADNTPAALDTGEGIEEVAVEEQAEENKKAQADDSDVVGIDAISSTMPVSAPIEDTKVEKEVAPASEIVDANEEKKIEETYAATEPRTTEDSSPEESPEESSAPHKENGDATTTNHESILAELQENLQHQMTVRAEVENKLRNQAAEIDEYKKQTFLL